MATEQNENALAKFGPIGAPILGVVVALGVIVGVIVTSGLGEKQAQLEQSLSALNSKLDSSDVTQDVGNEIPDASSVKAAMDQRPPSTWKGAPESRKLLELPMLWKLQLPKGNMDEFDLYDEDRDGYWSDWEFEKAPPKNMPGKMGDFKQWDKDKDGRISREEHKYPPLDDEQIFEGLDTQDPKGRLTEGEISRDEVLAWDRPDADNEYDNAVSLEEFRRRNEPKDVRNLMSAENVQVVENRDAMEIVVSWTAPSGADVPEDQSFFIYRLAPETVEQRKSEHRQRILRFTERDREWKRARDAWWDEMIEVEDPANAGGTIKKKRSAVLAGKNKDTEYTAAGFPPPVQPEEPTEWELVTESPVSGTEYRDTSFEGGVTYTYAVYTATQKMLLRGQKPHDTVNGWKVAAPAIQTSQPVMVSVRTWIEYANHNADAVNLRLSRWHRVVSDQGDHVGWHRFQIEVSVASDGIVGRKYKMAEMSALKLKVFNAQKQEVTVSDISSKNEVDFSTGWAYRIVASKKVRLEGNGLGIFELPDETRTLGTNFPAAAGGNQLEVRMLASNTRSGSAFHLVRWHQVGDAWFRVELTHTGVAGGSGIGREVDLSSPGSDVKIFDNGGKLVSDFSKFAGQKVDMVAGTFDGMDGRSFKVDGTPVDIWGVYYK